MPNRRHKYYVGNDVTFRGTFKIDCVEQTPDSGSALVTVMKRGESTPILDEVAGVIVGNQIRYFYADLPVGQYAIFLTASFNSGADQRTGVIEYVVRSKEAK